MLKENKFKEPYDYLFKIIVVGNSGVGKTNIILRFTENQQRINHAATIGIDFKIKTVDVKGTKVRMQIWDTAGQCRFRNITKTYFLGSSAVIFVYSIDDERSYEDVVSWIEQADEHSDNADQVRLLLGNKCDLEGENRKISRKQGEQLAKKYNMQFMQISAREGKGVKESFYRLGELMLSNKKLIKRVKYKNDHPSSIIENDQSPQKKKRRCC